MVVIEGMSDSNNSIHTPRLTTESIRSFLDVPRSTGLMSEDEWYDQYTDSILQNFSHNPSALPLSITELLCTYPHERLRSILIDGLERPLDPQEIREIRFLRKTIMVGRDTLRITTSLLEDEEPLHGAGQLANRLGKLVDAANHDPTQCHKDTLQTALHAAHSLVEVKLPHDEVILSHESMRSKIRRALAERPVLELSSAQREESINEINYHRARRLFRAAIHLGIVSAVLSPNQQKAQFVREGIELSSRYGDAHAALLAHRPSGSSQ